MAKETAKQAKPAGMSDELKAKIATAITNIRKNAPHVEYAWFNENGDYHFHKRPGFVKVYVAAKPEPEEEEEEIVLDAATLAPVAPAKPNDKLEF